MLPLIYATSFLWRCSQCNRGGLSRQVWLYFLSFFLCNIFMIMLVYWESKVCDLKAHGVSISSIKNVFIVKIIEINCHRFLSSHSIVWFIMAVEACNGRKSHLHTVRLNRVRAALVTHINLVMLYFHHCYL